MINYYSQDNIILGHWDGCPPLPANILSTIQKDLVSRGFVARSLPALKFRYVYPQNEGQNQC